MTLNALTKENNTLIGGSADLAGSNNTKTKYHNIIKPSDFNGDYIHYGVREHAMSGIMNGLALHSKFIPYGGTFLIFSDYCKPSIRLSALMQQRVIYVMTHDSIGLGEDGPTHQPIEQLSGLRSIPNLNVFRPADRMETIECWELALKNSKTPSVLSLTRQNLEPIRKQYSNNNKCSLGAYEVLRTNKKISLSIFASGSEVNLAMRLAINWPKIIYILKLCQCLAMIFLTNNQNCIRKKFLVKQNLRYRLRQLLLIVGKNMLELKVWLLELIHLGKVLPIKKFINILD